MRQIFVDFAKVKGFDPHHPANWAHVKTRSLFSYPVSSAPSDFLHYININMALREPNEYSNTMEACTQHFPIYFLSITLKVC